MWPVEDYPLLEFGRLVFDKNPENFHRDVEQLAFSPGRLVPGIEPSPDALLQFRMFFYNDAQVISRLAKHSFISNPCTNIHHCMCLTQLHRLGVNYHQIPVNCPFMAKGVHPITRDGELRADSNGAKEPHYMPNSLPSARKSKQYEARHDYNSSFKLTLCWGRIAIPDPKYNWMPERISGTLDRRPSSRHALSETDDYIPAAMFYNSMTRNERQHLHKNIAGNVISAPPPSPSFFSTVLLNMSHIHDSGELLLVSRQEIQLRFLAACYKVHSSYAAGIISEMKQLVDGLAGDTPNALLSTLIGSSGASPLPVPDLNSVEKLSKRSPLVERGEAAAAAATLSTV